MSESTDWQDYDWETDTIRDVDPDKVFDRPVVNGEYADLTNAEAYDWPTDLEVAPTPHEWLVGGRAATPAELQDWGARVRAGQHPPQIGRPVALPSEATAQATAAPAAQAVAKARLVQ